MHLIVGSRLIERLSSYNNQYYCIVEKVQFLPGVIRVYIDEHGDNSLGPLQPPLTSRLGIYDANTLIDEKSPIDGKFTISNASRQYFGYLDFAIDNSLLDAKHIIGFEYGLSGYQAIKLFRFNQELIDRFYVKPEETPQTD